MKKLIVSNKKALTAKYGSTGFNQIAQALARLVLADALRGITTIVEWLDSSKALGKRRVTRVRNERATKVAIDALWLHHERPDYLMLLGAQDVVVHQKLKNPVGMSANGDPDPDVPSDLPYACDVPYSKLTKDFIGPTRAVGRLPDHFRGKDAGTLVRLLDAAATSPPGEPATRTMAITAEVWTQATAEVLSRAAAPNPSTRVSPSDDAPVPAAALRPMLHLVNCHGAPSDPQFYGEDASGMPVALLATDLPGAILPGVVVAAECCYGSELYSPHQQHVGICNTYLDEGAAAFVGSTNVAYGAFTSQIESADVLCSSFLEHAHQGASFGRALLQARLDFVASVKPLSPFELKTLAQFRLLGDPSRRAFAIAGSAPKAGTSALKAKTLKVADAVAHVAAAAAPLAKGFLDRHRKQRRKLSAAGTRMAEWAATRSFKLATTPRGERPVELDECIKELRFKTEKVLEFHWRGAERASGAKSGGKLGRRAASRAAGEKVWIALERALPEAAPHSRASAAAVVQARTTVTIRALVLREVGGKRTMHHLVSR